MFEKEAMEYADEKCGKENRKTTSWVLTQDDFQKGAEFGYNKAKVEARLKLKDEGIIKSLKGSILRNERLSSQEQQELCAWIECAMDFGENLDECAKELEKANEWHYVKDGEYPTDEKNVLCVLGDFDNQNLKVGYYSQNEGDTERWQFNEFSTTDDCEGGWGVSAWKEIILPELKGIDK